MAADSWRQHVLQQLPRMEATGEQAGFTPGPMVVVPAQTPLPAAFSSQPPFDPIALLETTPAAGERLRMLRQRSADSHRLIPEFEQVRQASMDKIGAQNALTRLTSPAQDGGFHLGSDDRRVIEAQRLLDKAAEDFKRLTKLQEVRTAQWHAAGAALPNVESWLRDGRPHNTVLEAVEVEVPKPAKGEGGLLDQIENQRRRVRELKADLHRIQSAPYPSSHAKAQMREIVEQAALRGTPEVSLLIEHDRREIGWPMVRVRSEVLGTQGALAFHEAVDVVGLLAFLLKPTLISALDALIDDEKDDGSAMSHQQRQQRESEVQGDLLDVERQEAALTWQAQQQGLSCEHRADISPVALLGLRLVTAPRSAPPPTSPEHGYNIVGGRR